LSLLFAANLFYDFNIPKMKLNNPHPFLLSVVIFSFNICFVQVANAQLSVGIEGGYNKNYLVTNNANRAFTNYLPMNGFTVGVPLQYKIADWFAIETDPTYVQKNYSQQRSAFFVGVYQENKNAYVQLPLMGHFMFGGEQLKGFLNVGMYEGYWLTGHVNGIMPNILDINESQNSGTTVYDFENSYSYNEKYAFDKRKDDRMEAGWIGGLGLSYEINGQFQVFTEGRLLYSFTDQQKKYMVDQVPRYNTTYGINAGIMIHFNNMQTNH